MKLQKISASGFRLSYLLHMVGWIIIMLTLWYLFNVIEEERRGFLYHLFVNFTAYGILFYLNYFRLVPRYFITGKKTVYFFTIIVAIVCMTLATSFINKDFWDFVHEAKEQVPPPSNEQKINNAPAPPPPEFINFRIFNFAITSILISGFSLGLRLIEKVRKDEKIRKELEKEKLNSELAFLKNQISPHFFFNTLNNIYSLISINTEDAQESILKLSKLMRYLLYETERGTISLSEELAFLENYIDLMKLKLNNRVKLDISFPESYRNHDIHPLLFISFIENAFKHGVSYRDNSFIKIGIDVSDDELIFIAENSINKTTDLGDTHSGIGLENVKKRLQLLYPNTHSLSINSENNIFKIKLILKTP